MTSQGKRLKAGGSGDLIDSPSMQIHCPVKSKRTMFLYFSTCDLVLKKAFTGSVFTGTIWMMSKNYVKNAFKPKSISMWMAPKVAFQSAAGM